MGTAEEIANVVVFLASERASFVNGSAWGPSMAAYRLGCNEGFG
jgi:NAD(P)-dependent dehydrogenase (short-subunit alcohol dehydrogenase family)